MVGSAFKNIETNHKLFLVGTANYDLTRSRDCDRMLRDIKPDAIIGVTCSIDTLNQPPVIHAMVVRMTAVHPIRQRL